MASLRKASSYSRKKARPYTRTSKNKAKSYIKTVPHNQIVKYNHGDANGYNKGKYKFFVRLIAEERAQVRDHALESCRLLINKRLETDAPKQFYFEVRVYPHHLLRNNKTAAGAGADRLSTGMTHSFGVVEGRAALVQQGKDIFMVACENEKVIQIARETMQAIKSKVPCKSKIVVERLN